MALVAATQAAALAAENVRLRTALRSAVDEQDRLTARNAELAEALAAVEAERDLAWKQLGIAPGR